jgi:hypothetical protein
MATLESLFGCKLKCRECGRRFGVDGPDGVDGGTCQNGEFWCEICQRQEVVERERLKRKRMH